LPVLEEYTPTAVAVAPAGHPEGTPLIFYADNESYIFTKETLRPAKPGRIHKLVAGFRPRTTPKGMLYSEHPLQPRAAPQRRLTPRQSGRS